MPSPTPNQIKKVIDVPATMTFIEAIQAIIGGKKVTRLEWNNPLEYCHTQKFSEGTFFCVIVNGTLHKWIINDGDYLSDDWVVVETGKRDIQ